MDALVMRRLAPPPFSVIPAKAGISWRPAETSCPEIPAFAGMMELEMPL